MGLGLNIYIFCFVLLFTSSSPCLNDQFAVSYFSTNLIVLIRVYNWEVRYDGLCGEVPPERGTFFRLQVYMKGSGFHQLVYKRVGKSVIWVCERIQKG